MKHEPEIVGFLRFFAGGQRRSVQVPRRLLERAANEIEAMRGEQANGMAEQLSAAQQEVARLTTAAVLDAKERAEFESKIKGLEKRLEKAVREYRKVKEERNRFEQLLVAKENEHGSEIAV